MYITDSVEVIESPMDLNRSLGDDASLHCKFNLDAVTVHWERNDVDVTDNEAEVEISLGESWIYLQKLNFYHMARYKCVGEFFNSKAEASAFITINGKTKYNCESIMLNYIL